MGRALECCSILYKWFDTYFRKVGGSKIGRDLPPRSRIVGRILAIASFVAVALCIPAAGQRIPEAPLYQLLPEDWPYPLIRTCSTAEGICLIPFTIKPGQPCSCQRADGSWVDGVCIR